jgi:hypothetical protein
MKKRGASLIWAIVVSTVVFTISVTTSSFVIKESQMSVRMNESARAYAAAESGIEWGKYCIEKNLAACPAATTTNNTFALDGSTYKVTIARGTDDTIKSIGTSNGVNRQIDYVNKVGQNPVLLGASDNFTATGSYVQQFDYWTDGLSTSIGKIGIGDSVGTKAIYLEHYVDVTQKMRLVAKNGTNFNRNTDVGLPVSVDTAKISGPYNYRIRIEYTRDLYAKMTVMTKNATAVESFTCVSPIMIVDLRILGIGPSDLTRFYYSATPVAGAVGDGASYQLGTKEVYFDNMTTVGVVKN